MLNKIKNLVVAEEGQGLTEYGLLLAVVVGVIVTVVGVLGNGIDTLVDSVVTKITTITLP